MEQNYDSGYEGRLKQEIEALRCIFTESDGELALDDKVVLWLSSEKEQASPHNIELLTIRVRLDDRCFYSSQLFLKLVVDPKRHYITGPVELKVTSGEASVPFFLSDSQCSYIVNEARKLFVQNSECIYDQIMAAKEAAELVTRDLPSNTESPGSNTCESEERLEREPREPGLNLEKQDCWSLESLYGNLLPKTIMWGMRACYSHHIRNKIKRKLICDWARELSLGGFCKIGYPGIILAEGPEECCLEYTRRLQRLRWKHFVVRGEIITEIPLKLNQEGKIDLNNARKLPDRMIELPPEEMKTLAKHCDELGIKDLFLTTMKIYPK